MPNTNKNEPYGWQSAQTRYFKPRGYVFLLLGVLVLAFNILRFVNPNLAYNLISALFFFFVLLVWSFFRLTRQIHAVKHTIEKTYPHDIQTTADAVAHILQKKPIPSEALQRDNGYNFFVDDCAIVIKVRRDEFEHKAHLYSRTVVSIRPNLPIYEPLINSLTEKIDNALINPAV